MGAFDMLRIANSSLGMHQTWLDALAHNISNANTVTATTEDAFQAQMVVASARPEGGVDVAGIELSDAEGVLVHAPDSPHCAPACGGVRLIWPGRPPGHDTSSGPDQARSSPRAIRSMPLSYISGAYFRASSRA